MQFSAVVDFLIDELCKSSPACMIHELYKLSTYIFFWITVLHAVLYNFIQVVYCLYASHPPAGVAGILTPLRTLAPVHCLQVVSLKAGGIMPLITLVSDGTASQKEKAASALQKLASNEDNAVAITTAGGITPHKQLCTCLPSPHF